jgi:hypothetical protein
MQGTLREPNAAELYVILGEMLESFAYMPVMPLSGDVPVPELPLCYHAALPNSQGWLVLRGSAGLARSLAEASTGDAAEGLGDDALVELCNITASHLSQRLWNGGPGSWSSFVPQSGLPQGQSRAAVLMDLNGQTLEAGYWSAS